MAEAQNQTPSLPDSYILEVVLERRSFGTLAAQSAPSIDEHRLAADSVARDQGTIHQLQSVGLYESKL
jgi:hypothetical protein